MSSHQGRGLIVSMFAKTFSSPCFSNIFQSSSRHRADGKEDKNQILPGHERYWKEKAGQFGDKMLLAWQEHPRIWSGILWATNPLLSYCCCLWSEPRVPDQPGTGHCNCCRRTKPALWISRHQRAILTNLRTPLPCPPPLRHLHAPP